MTGTTPVYNIRHPNGASKANLLGPELSQMATDIEAALIAAEIPPAQPMSIVVAASDGARDAYWGVPVSDAERLALQHAGATTVRTDRGWDERYFATYNAVTNPGGTLTPGWYPVAGRLPRGLIKQGGNPVQNFGNATMTLVTSYSVTDGGFLHGMDRLNSTLIIRQAGLYRVRGAVAFNINATGIRLAQITLNSASDAGHVAYGATYIAQTTAYNVIPVETPPLRLAANDVLRLMAFQTSGVTLSNVTGAGTAAASSSAFEAEYLGPSIG